MMDPMRFLRPIENWEVRRGVFGLAASTTCFQGCKLEQQ